MIYDILDTGKWFLYQMMTLSHLLRPATPWPRLLRLFHLDQDKLLLTVDVHHHPTAKRPPHLELQQSVVPEVR